MSTQDVPTVFIVDDDEDVCESLQDLPESVGLHSKSFGMAQEFLSNPPSDSPNPLMRTSRHQRLGPSAQIEKRKSQYSHHFSHRTCGRCDVSQGHEIWSG